MGRVLDMRQDDGEGVWGYVIYCAGTVASGNAQERPGFTSHEGKRTGQGTGAHKTLTPLSITPAQGQHAMNTSRFPDRLTAADHF